MFPTDTKILIVDDMTAMRSMLNAHLHNLNFFNVIQAKDGLKALKTLEKSILEEEKIGLIISDWNMPNMSGIELLKKVKSNDDLSDIPFIMLTSESERDQVASAIISGVSHYIIKPFSIQTLEKTLNQVWNKIQT